MFCASSPPVTGPKLRYINTFTVPCRMLQWASACAELEWLALFLVLRWLEISDRTICPSISPSTVNDSIYSKSATGPLDKLSAICLASGGSHLSLDYESWVMDVWTVWPPLALLSNVLPLLANCQTLGANCCLQMWFNAKTISHRGSLHVSNVCLAGRAEMSRSHLHTITAFDAMCSTLAERCQWKPLSVVNVPTSALLCLRLHSAL